MSALQLDGRVIAIAGVGGGLGPLVAERLAARRGDRRRHRSQRRRRWRRSAPGCRRAAGTAARSTCSTRTRRAPGAPALVERFGRVDGLVHLVGGWRGGEPLHSAPLEDWDFLHELLIRTVQHTTRAFHDALVDSGHGRFVLVSAKQAQAPSNTNAAYAAAKAAAEAWTLALADGFASTGGATANIIVVDAILTPRMREESPGKEFPTFTPAEHIAAAIEFLCSDAAAEMNGQRLPLTMR